VSFLNVCRCRSGWKEHVVKLEVRLFAGLKCNNEGLPCFGQQEFSVDAPEGITVQGLHEFLKLRQGPLVTVVNGVVEKKDFIISDKDRVGIFPPVAGGAGAGFAALLFAVRAAV
jgi:sulfur carrier protein ThiS